MGFQYYPYFEGSSPVNPLWDRSMTLILENQNLFQVPLLHHRICWIPNWEIVEGKISLIWLSPRFKNSIDCCSKSIILTLVPFMKVLDLFPWSLFLSNSNIVSSWNCLDIVEVHRSTYCLTNQEQQDDSNCISMMDCSLKLWTLVKWGVNLVICYNYLNTYKVFSLLDVSSSTLPVKFFESR